MDSLRKIHRANDKRVRKFRRRAKQLLKAVAADLAASMPLGFTPPPLLIRELAAAALAGAVRSEEQPRQPPAAPPPAPVVRAARAPSSRFSGEGAVDVADPAPGLANLLHGMLSGPYAEIVAGAASEEEGGARAAAIVRGAFEGVLRVVWAAAARRVSAPTLNERLHEILGDAIVAVSGAAAPAPPGAARGPGGQSERGQ